MPEIGEEKAKAVQEVAKATVKAIDAAEKAGGFFSRVFGQPIEDSVGRYWGDKVAADRTIKAIDLAEKVQAKLNNAGVKNIRSLPNKISIPLLEAATLEDDPSIDEMWENLLMSALTPSEEQIERKYISVLSEFSRREAELLTYLSKYLYKDRMVFGDGREQVTVVKHPREFGLDEIKQQTNAEEDTVRSLMRMGIVCSVIEEVVVKERGDSYSGRYEEEIPITINYDIERFETTPFGRDFINRVTGKIET